MGYGTRNGGIGGDIRTYWPDDDENTLYIDAGPWAPVSNLKELLEKAQEKWPGISFEQLNISAEHIHTDCLGYDLYDRNDYTDFIIIRRIP